MIFHFTNGLTTLSVFKKRRTEHYMSQMLKSSGAMGVATLASRVLGMMREIVYANFMGDSAVAGAFKFAFQIPNLFRRLLGEGALTAAFIPIFKEKEKTEGEKEMWRAANAVISGLIVATAIVVGLVMAGISVVLAWKHLDDSTRLMLELLRLMFPYMLLICLTAVFMGMLNARGHFFVPAMGAAVLNLILIASVLFFAPLLGERLDTRIFAVAIGVLVAGAAQAAFQLPNLRREGFRYQWISPWRNDTVRQVVRKMIPGMLGVAAFQINVLVTTSVAFYIDEQIVASFDYAVRLMELPQGVFGISLATFLLPALAGLAAEKKYPEFRATLAQGLNHLVFINLLASVLLIVLAHPIIRLLFERGEFGIDSSSRAALALACLAPGLVAFSMVNILARAFYALGDTQTPMKISAVCLVVNLFFALMLIGPYRQAGLGVANSMSAMLNVALLLYALRRKLKHLDLQSLRKTVFPLAGAAVLAGMACWVTFRFWETSVGYLTLAERLGAVFVPMLAGTTVYFAVCLWARVPSASEIFMLLRARLTRKIR